MGATQTIFAAARAACAGSLAFPESESYALSDVVVNGGRTDDIRVRVLKSGATLSSLDSAAARSAVKIELAKVLFELQQRHPHALSKFIRRVQHTGATTPALLVNLLASVVDASLTIEGLTRYVHLNRVVVGAPVKVSLSISRRIHPGLQDLANESANGAVVAVYATNLLDLFSVGVSEQIVTIGLSHADPTPHVVIGVIIAVILVGIFVSLNVHNLLQSHHHSRNAMALVESHRHQHFGQEALVFLEPVLGD